MKFAGFIFTFLIVFYRYNLIKALAEHLVERYGKEETSSWFFEVWNEPDIGFWSGTQMEYFNLYTLAAQALKATLPTLRVGGPVSSNSDKWIAEFIQYTQKNNVPVDFISCHQYGGNSVNYGDVGTLVKVFSTAKSLADTIGVPLIVSEFGNTWQAYSEVLDEAATAAFVIAAVDHLSSINPLVLSYWTFSDIFEEGGFPTTNTSFYGGFGLQTLYGVAKPAYRAYQLLHQAGDSKAYASVSSPQGNNCKDTFGVLSLVDNSSESLSIFLYNHAIGGSPITDCTVQVVVQPLKNPHNSASQMLITRMDNNNANPKGAWISMGMPQYPTPQQISTMVEASQLKYESVTNYNIQGNSITLILTVLSHSLAVVTIPYV